ncbi:MAG TPA: carbamate kinase, partial [Nitrososphaerales archaeon]|nr:carbamate kinase [Nitrososphaerales archaeon]
YLRVISRSSSKMAVSNGERILVALGGNAIKKANESGTAAEQFNNCLVTSRHLVKIMRRLGPDDRLIVTHGNGPQAGNLMVQQDSGRKSVPSQPMDVVGAMTQGQIGYMLQQTFENCMCDEGIDRPVLVVINQVLVDEDDEEFRGLASKPVGDFLTEAGTKAAKAEHPEYIYKEVKTKGDRRWRRVVASPAPIRNVEGALIKRLVDEGVVVIASGGGGIPVVLDEKKHLHGVEAVIDKDLSAEVLAEVVGATSLIILTDVEQVKLNFGTKEERPIERMTVSEAKGYLEAGQFPLGTMGPKISACIKFLEAGGRRALVTSLEKAAEALAGETGTLIVPNPTASGSPEKPSNG